MTHDATDRPAPRWRPPFGLLGVIALAVVVYEATSSPALASVLVALKFGWEDFRTARWLRRTDPDPHRGKSLAWLYAAWGVWKSAAVALLMAVAFAALMLVLPNPPAQNQTLLAWLGTVLTAVFGFLAATALAAAAAMRARRGGYRLWLDSGVNGARRYEHWPPTPFCVGRRNRFDLLIVTALVLFMCGPTFLFYSVLMCLPPKHPHGILCLIVSIVFLIGAVGCFKALSAETSAYYPSECWPERLDLPEP